MGWLTSFIDRLLNLGESGPAGAVDPEELIQQCNRRLHHFRMLLAANSKVLEIMAELEEALSGTRTFGMSFVRARCTAAVVGTYNIIKHMDGLAPDRYTVLFQRLEGIQENLTGLVTEPAPAPDAPLAMALEAVDTSMADVVGSKMADLGEVRNNIGLPVPPGFAITVRGYQAFMEHQGLALEVRRLLQAADKDDPAGRFELSSVLQEKIMQARLPPELEHALLARYDELAKEAGQGVPVALRSSALGEDSAGATFAGQFRSILNIGRDALALAYKEVVASMYSLQALSYRLNRGIREQDAAMCVGVMAMVESVAGGVMYSRDPLNVRGDAVIIDSVWGLPRLVVDGSTVPDRFEVSRGADGDGSEGLRLTNKRVACKEVMSICASGEGVRNVAVDGERASQPSITDSQAVDLARMALALEERYGSPRDIEWALSRNGELFILQCRPMSDVGPHGVASAPEPRTLERFGESLISGGVTVCPGVGCGPVHVLERDADALTCPKDAVLVAPFAWPRWASLMSWASALVTEQGSLTGHLSCVAREFRVPAVMNLPGAVQALSGEEVVTVDADTGAVYPGRVEELLKLARPRPNLMQDSPVYSLLQGACQHITPLNLTDPDAVTFRARNVATLHDITRFCHEKSVHEMFELNMSSNYRGAGSRRLRHEGRRTQFWVVDMACVPQPGEKYVDLCDIDSPPMKALWEGIIAEPWAGPPRVNARGFASIVAEAASNPSLVAERGSKYANRNYFLVSQDYCNLQSRFGFHFTTVEVMAGERAQQNYINFRFAGGAANFERRKLRSQFIGELVEEFGFRARVKGDSLNARCDGLPQAQTCDRLRVLGYLLIHTRQLDMTMSDEAAARRHRDKLLANIRRVVPFNAEG